MDNKTIGAWIIHHTHKLQQVTAPVRYDHITLAGKAGILLSALSTSDQESTLKRDAVETVGAANGISSTLELPTLLSKLKEAQLIDIGASGDVHTLGITSASVLSHIHDIYIASQPKSHEDAAIAVAELVSQSPAPSQKIAEYVADTYKLPSEDTTDLLNQSETIGFIDYEDLGEKRKLYFNGNLFRRQDAKKAEAIISSLTQSDIQKVTELQELLRTNVCVPYQQVMTILGKGLFEKLQAIGMFDVNSLSNERETTHFVTRPSAFQKYGNSLVEDALDLAKAFATSLTYGMMYSPSSRGRITMLPQLMKRLIQGGWVGPATAIGQDYRMLELKRVVEVKPEATGMFSMRLLKKDIGQLALQAILQGDISEVSLPPLLHGVSITGYASPERNREIVRKQQITRSRHEVVDMLRTLRRS